MLSLVRLQFTPHSQLCHLIHLFTNNLSLDEVQIFYNLNSWKLQVVCLVDVFALCMILCGLPMLHLKIWYFPIFQHWCSLHVSGWHKWIVSTSSVYELISFSEAFTLSPCFCKYCVLFTRLSSKFGFAVNPDKAVRRLRSSLWLPM